MCRALFAAGSASPQPWIASTSVSDRSGKRRAACELLIDSREAGRRCMAPQRSMVTAQTGGRRAVPRTGAVRHVAGKCPLHQGLFMVTAWRCMNPVFLLLVHADPQQVRRLIRLLVPFGPCIVHVDAKVDRTAFQIDHLDVTYVDDRVNVHWAGISQVSATLCLMRAALAQCDPSRVSHFVLLSGSCYPVRPLEELSAFLSNNQGVNFIKQMPLDGAPELESRVRHLWFYEDFPVDGRRFTRTRLLRGVLQLVGKFARRSLSLIPRWHVGSQWWALTPEAVSYLATFLHESQVKRFLRFSKAPDEIYFHTLLAHSPHRHTVESVRGGGVWDAANLHLIDPSLSRWFEASDYEEVVSSGKWFVRKVSTQSSGDLCTRLDGHRTVVEEFGHQTAQPASGESRPPVD